MLLSRHLAIHSSHHPLGRHSSGKRSAPALTHQHLAVLTRAWCMTHRFSSLEGSPQAHPASTPLSKPVRVVSCAWPRHAVHSALLLDPGVRYDGRRYFDDCFEFPLQKPVEEAVLTLSGDLQPMVDNPQFSDVTFVVEGQQVHAHKFILYARSEYFRRMFTSGYREATDKTITIPDVSYDVFLAVLSYLYTGTSKDIDPQMACEVLGVANLYGIEPLKRTCADMMMRAITISNVASILQAADTYQVGQLRSHCISYMVEHFAEVVKSESFSELISTPTRPLVLLFLEEAASRMRLPSHTAMGSECE